MSAPEFNTKLVQALHEDATREEAARQIVAAYMDRLRVLIHQHLSDRLRGRVDADDVLQSVWGSFFGRPYDIKNRKSLHALLCRICVNKARSVARHHLADKRDVHQEAADPNDVIEGGQHLPARSGRARVATPSSKNNVDDASPQPDESDSFFENDALELMAMGATGEQAMFAIEAVAQLSEELQQILAWRIENVDDSEIAKRQGCTRRTVTRRLKLIREHLRNVLGDLALG